MDRTILLLATIAVVVNLTLILPAVTRAEELSLLGLTSTSGADDSADSSNASPSTDAGSGMRIGYGTDKIRPSSGAQARAVPANGNVRRRHAVSGFDPEKDVFAYGNFGGAGHCCAMSTLVYQFHRQFKFRQHWPAVGGTEWRRAYANDDIRRTLRLVNGDGSVDPVSAAIVGEAFGRSTAYKARSLDFRTTIGGYDGLCALSAVPAVERLTKAWATNIQGDWTQIRTAGFHVATQVLTPGSTGRLNKNEANAIYDTLASTDLPVAVSLHDRWSVGGHVILVYEGVEYDDRYDFYVYDCNTPPPLNGNPTILRVHWSDGANEVVRRDGAGTLRVQYGYPMISKVDANASNLRSRLSNRAQTPVD